MASVPQHRQGPSVTTKTKPTLGLLCCAALPCAVSELLLIRTVSTHARARTSVAKAFKAGSRVAWALTAKTPSEPC